MRNLIDIEDLKKDELNKIIDDALKIEKNPKRYSKRCKSKILATLFYEPSTRTQLSFQTAMLRLGGSVIGFDNPNSSSVAKGENLKDTIKIVSGYADLIAIRHPYEGAAKAASMFSRCSVINAGDGGHLHPTQTLVDLVTLKKEKKTLDNLKIGICGDLKYGRTVHSLVRAMLRYKNNSFIFISTSKLGMPKYIIDELDKLDIKYEIKTSLEESIKEIDVLYMTRIQRERFDSINEYEEQKDIYCLTKDKMKLAKKSLRVLHPLPRVDEIDMEVDNDERAVYFEQARLGVYARMSLIMNLLKLSESNKSQGDEKEGNCKNPKCITNVEGYLDKKFSIDNKDSKCIYCDWRE